MRGDLLVSIALLAVALLLLTDLSPGVFGAPVPPASSTQGGSLKGVTAPLSSNSPGTYDGRPVPRGCAAPVGWLPTCSQEKGVGLPLISSNSPWQQVLPTTNPGSNDASASTMSYDPADGYVLLWVSWSPGGSQTWVFNAGNWKQLVTNGTPPDNYNFPSMTFDPDPSACFVGTKGCMVLMEGHPLGGEYEWQYAGGTWVNATTSLARPIPLPQDAMGLVFDQNLSDCHFSFGAGATGCLLATTGVAANNSCSYICTTDTYFRDWVYFPQNRTWFETSNRSDTSLAFPGLQTNGATSLFWDPTLGHVLMRAPGACWGTITVPKLPRGINCLTRASTIELTSSGWSFLPFGCLGVPYCSTSLHGVIDGGLTFDQANDFAFFFGGGNASGPNFNTSWSYYGDQAVPAQAAWLDLDGMADLGTGQRPSPTARVAPLLAYDPNSADCGAAVPAHGCVLLFGGASYAGIFGYIANQDTWRFWLPVTPVLYADPDPVPEGKTLWLNVTVVGGTGHFVWFNRTFAQPAGYPSGCGVATIADDLHSRVSCVPVLSPTCTNAHANEFNVTVAVTDSAGEQGYSGWDPLEVDPRPLITHFYARYPVWWQGVDMGALDPTGVSSLTENFGVATWAQQYDPSDPFAWLPVYSWAVLVQEQRPLTVTAVSWDRNQTLMVSLSPSQMSRLPLDDSIEFSIALGPGGTQACATVNEVLNLNDTYGKHRLPYFPVGLGGQFGAVDPGTSILPLMTSIPGYVGTGLATINTLAYGDQGGHGFPNDFNATWYVNTTISVNLKQLLGATLPDPVSGAASFAPTATLVLSLSSVGKVAFTGGLSWSLPVGKVAGVKFSMTLSFTVQAKFQVEQYYSGTTQVGGLVLTNLSLSFGLKVSASVTYPIYGISLGPLGNVGLTMTVGVFLGTTIGLFFNQSSSPMAPQDYFLGWLPVVLQKVEALIAIGVSVALGLALAIASVSFGGSLEFDIYLQSGSQVLRGMDLIATVFVTVSVLFWSWTDDLYQGMIWSTGNPTPGYHGGPTMPAAANNTFAVGARYYNVSGYQALDWTPGAAGGPLMNDLYPGGSLDMAPTPTGADLLYATDNVSMPRDLGLTLGLLSLNSQNRTATQVPFPVPAGELAFDPRLQDLGGGKVLALWNSVPGSATHVAAPTDLTSISLQSSTYDPASQAWGPVSTVPTGSFPTSFAAGSCGGDPRVVHLDTPSLLGHGGSLVEEDLATGATLATVSAAPLAAQVTAFDCPSSLATIRDSEGNYSVVNLTSGSLWNIPRVPGYNLSYVSGVAGGSGDLAVLYRSDRATLLQIESADRTVLSNVSLPENVSAVQAQFAGGSVVVDAQTPDAVQLYLVHGPNVYLVRDLPWRNLTQSRLAVSSSGVATLVGETKNDAPGLPWYNLSAAYVPLTAVGAITATPGSVDAGAPVTFSASADSVNAPLQYAWSGLPPGCASLDAPSITCTPTMPGTYPVSVEVTDTRGTTVSSPVLSFSVDAPPASGSVNVSRSPVEVGSSVTLTAPTLSGVTNSTVAYLWTGLPAGCVSADTPLVVCSPSAPGNFTVGVTESDARGASLSEAPVSLQVVPRLQLASLTSSVGQVEVGAPVRFSASGEGGVLPYTFSWGGLPNGCPAVSASSFTCSFSSPGTYWVTVDIIDAQGVFAAGSVKVVVVAAPSGGPALPLPELLLLIGLAGVGVANVAVWWWPRRRRTRGSSADTSPSGAYREGERSGPSSNGSASTATKEGPAPSSASPTSERPGTDQPGSSSGSAPPLPGPSSSSPAAAGETISPGGSDTSSSSGGPGA